MQQKSDARERKESDSKKKTPVTFSTTHCCQDNDGIRYCVCCCAIETYMSPTLSITCSFRRTCSLIALSGISTGKCTNDGTKILFLRFFPFFPHKIMSAFTRRRALSGGPPAQKFRHTLTITITCPNSATFPKPVVLFSPEEQQHHLFRSYIYPSLLLCQSGTNDEQLHSETGAGSEWVYLTHFSPKSAGKATFINSRTHKHFTLMLFFPFFPFLENKMTSGQYKTSSYTG